MWPLVKMSLTSLPYRLSKSRDGRALCLQMTVWNRAFTTLTHYSPTVHSKIIYKPLFCKLLSFVIIVAVLNSCTNTASNNSTNFHFSFALHLVPIAESLISIYFCPEWSPSALSSFQRRGGGPLNSVMRIFISFSHFTSCFLSYHPGSRSHSHLSNSPCHWNHPSQSQTGLIS